MPGGELTTKSGSNACDDGVAAASDAAMRPHASEVRPAEIPTPHPPGFSVLSNRLAHRGVDVTRGHAGTRGLPVHVTFTAQVCMAAGGNRSIGGAAGTGLLDDSLSACIFAASRHRPCH